MQYLFDRVSKQKIKVNAEQVKKILEYISHNKPVYIEDNLFSPTNISIINENEESQNKIEYLKNEASFYNEIVENGKLKNSNHDEKFWRMFRFRVWVRGHGHIFQKEFGKYKKYFEKSDSYVLNEIGGIEQLYYAYNSNK